MTLAQRLYEGVDLPGEGTVGLITYMRTDSVNIAEAALREIAELVRTEFGAEYALAEPRRFKTQVAERAGGPRGDPADRRPCGRRTGSPPPWTGTSSACTA